MKEKINKIIQKVLAINLILFFLASPITIALTKEETQNVEFLFNPVPKIDVVLAKQRSTTDVTNFKEDLLKALEKRGINEKLVKITSVEIENVNFAENFNWEKDVSSSIGGITINETGNEVTMVGNRTLPGKNAIWIIPEESQEQEFKFSYNIDYGDSFNAAGMLLRVEKNENELTGYMLSFNNKWVSAAGNCNGAIWEFKYTIGDNSTNITKTLKKGLSIEKSGTLNVKVTDSQIEITGGGLANTEIYALSNSFGNGYGFFADHYKHNCSQIGSFALKGIELKTTIVKNLSEVLRDPTWRKGAIKSLVSISDEINKELNTDEGKGEVVTRLLNENIHYIPWGKDEYKEQYEDLIKANNRNGKFINNTEYENSIEQTAEYIKSLIEKIEPRRNYLLLDEPITIMSNPNDILKNTIDDEWPYGKWKIEHDYTYYENNIGQFSETNKYINDMVEEFNKTGKFKITYENQEISPNEIYVHRKPIAKIKMIKNENNVEFISDSYDLDLYSSETKGIKEEEWKYKKINSLEWIYGKPEILEENEIYMIQLRVKDYQDEWSNIASLFATTKTNNKNVPIASFDFEKSEITKYEELEIIDQSYDPLGNDIISHTWEVVKEGAENSIYVGNEPPIQYEETGNYIMKLTVENSDNVFSEVYTRKFKIIEDMKAPEVIITPLYCDWKTSEFVNIKFYDEGKSGFKNYKYAITNTQDTPILWSEEIENKEDMLVIEEEGRKYLHIIMEDNEGNISKDRVCGEYLIDRSGPDLIIDLDTVNIKIDELKGIIAAEDKYSGLKILTINGTVIPKENVRFSKNGIYEIYAEDNIGNSTTKTIVINNIYHECKAGLNHPIYSSDYDKCPICEKIKDIHVVDKEGNEELNQSIIYDGDTHRVEYEIENNVEVAEYYNGEKALPRNVGEYNYELKVIYEGKEYETGIKGVYTIIPREITVEGITGVVKKYDRTPIVEIEGGELINVVDGDDVKADIPKFRRSRK